MAANTKTKKPKSTGRIKTTGVKRHRYGPVVAVIFIILLAAAGIIGYQVIKSINETGSTKKSEETSKTETSEKSTKEAESTNQKSEETKTESATEETTQNPARETEKNNAQYEGENANDSASLTGIVNYVGLVDGSFNVRISVDQTVANGTCDFALVSPSGRAFSFSNAMTHGPTSTYCSLTVPFENLDSEQGTWKITATVTSISGKTGIITGEGTI